MGITSLRRHHVDPQYGPATKTTYTEAEHKELLVAHSRTVRQERDYELANVRAAHARELGDLRAQIEKLEATVVERAAAHAVELEQHEAQVQREAYRRASPKLDEEARKERARIDKEQFDKEREEHRLQQQSLPQTQPQPRPPEHALTEPGEKERLLEEKEQADDRETFRQEQASLPRAQQPGRGYVQPGADKTRPGEAPETHEERERQKQPAVPYRENMTPEPTPGESPGAWPEPDKPHDTTTKRRGR